MKNILLAAVALAALATPALSQQAFYGQQAAPWTGVYGGVDIAGSWGNGSLWVPGTIYNYSRNETNNGVIGGGFVGYNYQFNHYVFGLQGGFDGASTGNSHTSTTLGGDVFQSSFNQNWIASMDGRFGYAMGAFMPYAIGGVAWNSQSAHLTDLTTGFYHGGTNTPIGYDLGLGAEYAITPNWIARAEYRYYNFGSSNYAFVNPVLGSTYYHTTLTDNVARIGIAYKF